MRHECVPPENACRCWHKTAGRILIWSGALAPLWADASAPSLSQTRTTYCHGDATGNVRVETDDAGTTTAAHRYEPFGLTLPDETLRAAAPRFGGKPRDPVSSLEDFGARDFTSADGRFLATDPAAFASKHLAHPQGLNLHGYALNNPFKFGDPDGREVLAYFSVGNTEIYAVETHEDIAQVWNSLTFWMPLDSKGDVARKPGTKNAAYYQDPMRPGSIYVIQPKPLTKDGFLRLRGAQRAYEQMASRGLGEAVFNGKTTVFVLGPGAIDPVAIGGDGGAQGFFIPEDNVAFVAEASSAAGEVELFPASLTHELLHRLTGIELAKRLAQHPGACVDIHDLSKGLTYALDDVLWGGESEVSLGC